MAEGGACGRIRTFCKDVSSTVSPVAFTLVDPISGAPVLLLLLLLLLSLPGGPGSTVVALTFHSIPESSAPNRTVSSSAAMPCTVRGQCAVSEALASFEERIRCNAACWTRHKHNHPTGSDRQVRLAGHATTWTSGK